MNIARVLGFGLQSMKEQSDMHLTPVRVLSNVASLDTSQSPDSVHIENHYLGKARNRVAQVLNLLRAAIRSYHYDAIFLNGASFDMQIISVLKHLLPANRCKLISADLVLRAPRSWWQFILARTRRVLLKRVDLFILNHRDFSGYERFYGIDKHRVKYVPFKVNALHLVRQHDPVEGEYVFSAGVTLRDWTTLAKAVSGLDIRLHILTANQEYIRRTGLRATPPRREAFHGDVEFIPHDGNPESWVAHMAGAKFVVLAISPLSINASGISTYLCAMALRKCVIITEGPSTRGILDEHTSVIVPPSDPDALRRAIIRVDSDADFRRRIAGGGYRYAMSCGDVSRLHRDFIACILSVTRQEQAG